MSTGRPGYDTPSGTFKANRMDADHYSQEWDNAPMPHAAFFDLDGHAIHGFFDVKHLGRAVSHGCVQLSPDHAATLYSLLKAQGMSETKVVVAGHTPGGDNAPVARSRLPMNETVSSDQGYGQQPSAYYGQQDTGSRITASALMVRRAMSSGRIRASPITGSPITPSRVTAMRRRPMRRPTAGRVTV